MYIVGGRDKHNNTLRDMYSFNPLTGIFTTLSPMLIKRSNVGIAVMNKHMYVVGGIGSDREVLTMVEKYDFERVNNYNSQFINDSFYYIPIQVWNFFLSFGPGRIIVDKETLKLYR